MTRRKRRSEPILLLIPGKMTLLPGVEAGRKRNGFVHGNPFPVPHDELVVRGEKLCGSLQPQFQTFPAVFRQRRIEVEVEVGVVEVEVTSLTFVLRVPLDPGTNGMVEEAERPTGLDGTVCWNMEIDLLIDGTLR